MELGSTVYLVDGKEANGKPRIIETTVTKVGTKYFQIAYRPRRNFHRDSFLESQAIGSSEKVYPSRLDLEESLLAKRQWEDLSIYFREHSLRADERVPLGTIYEMHSLISPFMEKRGKK